MNNLTDKGFLNVPYYSIKDLEKLSGIKAHTLRIWEQRYGILKPERTDSNIRRYSNSEMKTLLNIVMLYNNGFKISAIAGLSDDKLVKEVSHLSQNVVKSETGIDMLIVAMLDLDEERFDKVLSSAMLKMSFDLVMKELVMPFLRRIGVMWQTGAINPAQEHFISNLVRQKLIVANDGLYFKGAEATEKWVLFLPEGELHEISLLFCQYILKKQGKKVIYLGQSVPMDDLQKVIELIKPNAILTVLTYQLLQLDPQEYLNTLARNFPLQKIYVSGFQAMNPDLIFPNNSVLFQQPEDLLKMV